LGRGKSTAAPSTASSQCTCICLVRSGKLLSHRPLFLLWLRWSCSYSHICSFGWNVSELPYTRTESSWNWVLDHMVLPIWCICPHSESIHGAFMACMFAWSFCLWLFLWHCLKAKVYTTRSRTIDDLKATIRKQVSAHFSDTAKHGEADSRKPVSQVGRVFMQWWLTFYGCALKNEINRGIMKCTWNKMAFSVYLFCNKIKNKMSLLYILWKSSGSCTVVSTSFRHLLT
jgi:hypothetical protein